MSLKTKLNSIRESNRELFTPCKIAAIICGTAIASFGLHNIHQQTNITEGGVLGMILLLNHWFGASPSITTPFLDLLCYGLAFKQLGWNFIKVSILSTFSLSAFFKLWELFPPMLPDLSGNPFIAAILGGLFVGIGVGLIVRQGGSSGGDDALALVISRVTHCKLAKAYLFTDITVLLLSLSYIPVSRIAFSLVTVMISGPVIQWMQKARLPLFLTRPAVKTTEQDFE